VAEWEHHASRAQQQQLARPAVHRHRPITMRRNPTTRPKITMTAMVTSPSFWVSNLLQYRSAASPVADNVTLEACYIELP
jgi:hypothetical protein